MLGICCETFECCITSQKDIQGPVGPVKVNSICDSSKIHANSTANLIHLQNNCDNNKRISQKNRFFYLFIAVFINKILLKVHANGLYSLDVPIICCSKAVLLQKACGDRS